MDKIKNLGQVYTPEKIVDYMLSLRQNSGNVLEPSSGTGVFSSKLDNCISIEIDKEYAINGALNMDFFDYSIDNKFDTIIGNPPYVDFKSILDSSDNELTLAAIQYANPATLMDPSIKMVLSDYYKRTKLGQNRLAILSKWSEMNLDSIEMVALSSLLGKYQNQFKQELALLSYQDNWPEISYYHLATFIKNEPNLLKKEEVFHLVYSRQNQFSKAFKKEFKNLIKEEKLNTLMIE